MIIFFCERPGAPLTRAFARLSENLLKQERNQLSTKSVSLIKHMAANCQKQWLLNRFLNAGDPQVCVLNKARYMLPDCWHIS